MLHTENLKVFYAEENKIILDNNNKIMGFGLCLGDADSIDNYKEVELTEVLQNQYNELVKY